MAIKYQFAYNDAGNIVNISDAVKGISYRCISCNDMLITKRGKIRQWHFCHKHEQDNCSVESYLHKLAKQRFFDIYNDCLVNNKPFFIEIKTYKKSEPCQANGKFNACEECNYGRTKTDKFDLTKWFKNIEIEKTVGEFRADLCLSTIDDPDKIFIEVHVAHKISKTKQNSKYRIIEIDIENEDDILSFDSKTLIQSEKIRFFNFKTSEKTIANDGKCEKEFRLLFLNKNGVVRFKDNINILELNKELSEKQKDMVEYLIVQPEYYKYYNISDDCESCWELPDGPDSYKYFIANCAKKNLNVKSCFICRYHAEADSVRNTAPIFCKFLKKECSSTQAAKCEYFRKENNYVNDLLKQEQDDKFFDENE
jgi:hypothetical protein